MNEAIQKIEQPVALDVFGAGFERAQRMAMALAESKMVPDRFQKDIGSCLIALDMATRLGMAPIAVMQKMYVVHGQPGFEGTFVIAAVNQCQKYSKLRFRHNSKSGDEYGVYATAEDLKTKEVLNGTTITWKMVKAEGWNQDKRTKTGGTQRSKWNTIPEQMFKYRAAAFWVREFDPGLIMGLNTVDELKDIGPATVTERDGKPVKTGPVTLDDVADELAGETPEELKGDEIHVSYRKKVIDLAERYWGEDAMMRLSEMCRSMKPEGFSISTATMDQLEAVETEIIDRMDADGVEL